MEEPIFDPVSRMARMKRRAVIDRDHFVVLLQNHEAQYKGSDLAEKINETLAQAIRAEKTPEELEEFRTIAVGRNPEIAGKIREIDDIQANLGDFPRP